MIQEGEEYFPIRRRQAEDDTCDPHVRIALHHFFIRRRRENGDFHLVGIATRFCASLSKGFHVVGDVIVATSREWNPTIAVADRATHSARKGPANVNRLIRGSRRPVPQS